LRARTDRAIFSIVVRGTVTVIIASSSIAAEIHSARAITPTRNTAVIPRAITDALGPASSSSLPDCREEELKEPSIFELIRAYPPDRVF
jgi:hypothetical protein